MAEIDSTNEVILDGTRFRTRGPIPFSDLSVFQGKVTFGDYTQDSNPLLSSFVMSDFSGGHGIEDMNEGSDAQRYKLGTFYTRFPSQIAKGYRINTVTRHASWSTVVLHRFLGDLKVSGSWVAIVAVGTSIRRLNDTSVTVGTLTAEPVNSSVSFRGEFANTHIVIPMGAAGYANVRNSAGYNFENIAPDTTHPALQAATVWDNKLVGIDTLGQLWWTVNPTSAGTWSSYGKTARLPNEETPLKLVNYFDRSGMPAIFIVTETNVWQFDPSGPNLWTLDVAFPLHPHHGQAAERWSGDLYFSVGLGVHRYTGGALTAMGLDRDNGLPEEWSGSAFGGAYITDMVGGYNALYALVSRPTAFSVAMIDGVSTPLYSSLHEWSGAGWHMLWDTDDIVAPYSLGISRAQESYRLYWGSGVAGVNALRYIDLPVNFANPRQRSRLTGGFTTNGWLETGIFDANMKGYNKTANALDVRIAKMDASAVLTVKYKINGATAWTTLGVVTTTGVTSLPFGALTNGIYPGQVFERIQFRFDLADSTNNAFVMESVVLSFIKLMPSSLSWTLELDLMDTGPGGDSPKVMQDKIKAIIETGLFVPMVHRGVTYRAFVSQSSGANETGLDERGFARVSVLQIPQSLGAA